MMDDAVRGGMHAWCRRVRRHDQRIWWRDTGQGWYELFTIDLDGRKHKQLIEAEDFPGLVFTLKVDGIELLEA